MWNRVAVVSAIFLLSSCSAPPPTPENYVARTRALEATIANYVRSGARTMKWSDLQEMVDDHVSEWGSDTRQPVACKMAAKALFKSVLSTIVGWDHERWAEAYVEYVDKQVDCEKAVEGKVSDRVIPSMLTPGNGVPSRGG
jgi:hypothetical protein